MELEQVKLQTTWNDAAERINRNSTKVASELTKLQNATYKNKGYFASAEALASAYPTGSAGSIAYVGNAYPFAIYTWNTSTNSWANTGYTGGDDGVVLGDYYTQEEADATFVDHNELNSTLSGYYTKATADNTFVTPAEMGEALENVYTKTEAETKFVTEMSVTNKLSGYYTKSQADAAFVSPSELSSSLANHYTKAEANSRFIDSAELEGRIGDLATDLELANAVSSLEDKIERTEAKLGDYYTKAETHEAIKDEYEVLSQTAYESLVSKEEKLYFCYEEDE